MKIKNAFQIFFKNYDLVVKVALTQLIVVAVFLGLGTVLVGDMAFDFNSGMTQYGILEKLNAIIQEIVSPNFSALHLRELVSDFQSGIFEWTSQVDLFYHKLALSGMFAFVFVMLLEYFLNLSNIPFAENLNDFMSTSSRTPYFWRYFKSFGKSLKVQILNVVLPFMLDAFIVFGVIGVYTTVFSLMGLTGLVLSFVILVIFLSLRKTLFAFWFPAMVVRNLSIKKSMSEGIKAISDVFPRVFLQIFLTTLVSFGFIAVLLLAKVHWATVLIVIFFYIHKELFVSCLSMVEYYRYSGFEFYLNKMKTIEE